MTGPIVAECGYARVEFRHASEDMWEIWSGGDRIGYACADVLGAAVDTERFTFGRPSIEEAAVTLAVKLHDDYLEWERQAPSRALSRRAS